MTTGPDWEIVLAIAEDRAETAERELAAIRWRAQAIRVIPFIGLFLDPVTSTTPEVCDALEDWARTMDELTGISGERHAVPVADVLAGIDRARQVYA